VDVLVELNGPTRANRMGVLAHRPAPVQVDYLGWPGSVGGRVVDYVVGDAITVPPGAEAAYPEQVIRLSKVYQVNDYAARTLPPKLTKKAVGLPEGDYLVLGMFNAINKVHNEVWDVWMKILQAVPNALLWILDPGPQARKHIAQAAMARGVPVNRILAAPRLKEEQHLARLQHCDLMLDPWPYGGHTSTADALFAGVPVVALDGNNFASRVSGALLRAAGMSAMVQQDRASYARFAVGLLKNPTELARVKAFVREQVPKTDVFNAKDKARQLEAAYRVALERAAKGVPLEHIRIKPRVAGKTNTQPRAELKPLSVAIVSWAGKHQRAAQIASALMNVTSDIVIVYSDDQDPFEAGAPCKLIRTSNQLYWGDKFHHALQSAEGRDLLIIHADCECTDWVSLFNGCQLAFAKNKDVALWTPLVHGTAYPPEITGVASLGGLDVVSYVDGIVFGIKSHLAPRMRSLDYSRNIYGWGIDWFIAAHVYARGELAVVDRRIVVHHETGRGYESGDALRQMSEFMAQMTRHEKIVFELLRSHVRYRRASLSERGGARLGNTVQGAMA
jgi:hypothetical protein